MASEPDEENKIGANISAKSSVSSSLNSLSHVSSANNLFSSASKKTIFEHLDDKYMKPIFGGPSIGIAMVSDAIFQNNVSLNNSLCF